MGVAAAAVLAALVIHSSGGAEAGQGSATGASAVAAPTLTPVLAKDDTSLPPLVRQEYALDERCRGENVTVDSAVCRQRDAVAAQLAHTGWCYGEPGDSGATSVWHECVAREKAPIGEKHAAWIDECQSAIQRDLNDPGSADFPSARYDADAYAHMQPDQTDQPDAAHMSAAALEQWSAKHPEDGQETITFKFRAKNTFGGVQRYSAVCTFQDNLDGTAKLVEHNVGGG